MEDVDIFLAYAHEDIQIIAKFAHYFKNSGFKTFYDRENIEHGNDIYEIIDGHIRTSKCLIVFWSSNSVKSKEVQAEARYAKKQKILLPVFIENNIINSLPYDFQVLHTIDLSNWNGDYEDNRFGVLKDAVNLKTGKRESGQPNQAPSEASKLGLTFTNIDLNLALNSITSNINTNANSNTNSYSQPNNISKNNPLSAEHPLQPGDRIGHCRVIDLIATGGMANVYKVWHEQLEVVRAIKILKPDYTEESKGRLEMEAKISANLRHPNIVDIYYMGYWNRIPYIEMEYVAGPSLKELLESRMRLSIPLAISITHMLCIALRFAHNQDMTLYGKVYDRLIHRDIKPANILLDAKEGIVKLADFGIARPSEVHIHTVGTKIMGTFSYLSPEQLNGEKLDQRSDIYAIGAVLYEMISGVKTFPQKLLADLIQKKSKGYYTPLQSMGLSIPRSLIDIIEKCLHLNRDKRYSDIIDLDTALLSVLKNQTSKECNEILKEFNIEPTLPVAPIKNSKFKAKHPLVIAIVGLFFLVFVVSFSPQLLKNKLTKEVQQSITQNSYTLPDILNAYLINSSNNSLTDIPEPVPPAVEYQKSPKVKGDLSLYQNGLKAFKSGNYTAAIIHLRMVTTKNADYKKVNLAKTLLLESLIQMKQFGRAMQIIENDRIETSHFYLLKGELLFQLKKTVESMDAINKALTFEQIDSAHYSRIFFLKAKISEEIYNLKPNPANMRKMTDDWKAYLDCLKWQ